jgi:TolB-like protein/class 3 adenylate cyclase/thioredoxin-like negative regulator of GroEL
MERRLAAVMIADVAGYGHLSQTDEEGTRAHFQAELHEVFEPNIANHHGRLVKTMGDALLVEFHSVVDALRCAVDVQRTEAGRNAALPSDRRMVFRIGINLGDVIVEGDDIHGDGVNIADRLQQLADSGGIVISGTAYDQVEKKLDVGYESLGERRVKNIDKPVRVYRVRMDADAVGKTYGVWQAIARSWRRPVLAVGALAVLVVAGAMAWWQPWEPRVEPSAIERSAMPLSDKPSIAVLPFGNLGSESEQAYFAQGLTDDLITDLSKISGLLVIARNSTSAYQGSSTDVRDVAAQLGVRYVLEGSVRRSGESVRINVQLIDGATGANVWAERYDRAYAEIFVLQDELIRRIVDALSVRLTESEKTQIARLPTNNLEAYDNYTRAEQKVYDLSAQSIGEALSLYQTAIALDPQFADAYAGYARTLVDVVSFDYQPVLLNAVARQQAYEAAGRALELNPQTARAYAVLGILQSLDGEHDAAIASVQKAVTLAPNSADALLNMAIVLIYAGQQPEALAAMERVLQLNPKPQAQVYDYYALALFMNKRYEEAVQAVRQAGATTKSDLALEVLAMAYARLGRTEDTHKALEAYMERLPAANLTATRVIYGPHRRQDDLDNRVNALRDAGVPEWPYGFRGSSADRLDGAAIRALATGRTWVGHQHGGAPFVMQVTAKGEYAQRGPLGLIAGKVTFEGDLMCMQSGAVAAGRKFCSPVYRNPGGSSEGQDEYVFPDVATIWYFSAAP